MSKYIDHLKKGVYLGIRIEVIAKSTGLASSSTAVHSDSHGVGVLIKDRSKFEPLYDTPYMTLDA